MTTRITTNAGDLADRYKGRAEAWTHAVEVGVRKAALGVEGAQVKRLSGTGEPFGYPVPVRTGHLRRSTFVRQDGPALAIVGNTADYAHAVHSGVVGEWAGRGKHRTVQRQPRPFLDDAVKDVDPPAVIRAHVVRALGMAV